MSIHGSEPYQPFGNLHPCARNGFKPQVISKVLAKRGSIRGIRLIHCESLLDYLDSLPSTTDGNAARENTAENSKDSLS